MGLLYGENCMILTSAVFAWITRVTDGQTDGIAIVYARLQHTLSRAKIAASGSNVTKLFHATCRNCRGVKLGAIFGEGPPPNTWEGKKRLKSGAIWATIDFDREYLRNGSTYRKSKKYSLSTTTPPTSGEKRWTLVHKQKSYRRACWRIHVEFFERLHFGR